METDILVIGSGIAGLSFALKASKYANIILVSKQKLSDCNSNLAQGGLAAVFAKDDSFKMHVKDTLRAGDGLCNKKAVEFLVRNAPKQILWLKKQGVKFDKQLSKEAVHSKARIVHSGDMTGEKIEEMLIKNVKDNPKIKYIEDGFVFRLLKKNKKCMGALILKDNKILTIFAKSVILATGGLGRLYNNTCNPEVATGDGFALAYDAGAYLQDMEFVQFHPTGLYKSNPVFLISETLRGEGGKLKNRYGEIYMPKYHRDGGLAPRDVVSKFSIDEMKKTKADHVYLDMTHLDSEYLKKRFPNIYKKCLSYNVDLTKKPIPVTPTAHYSCGGIKIDLNARTNINGLYAIGEVSCSGIHGADRLASNSLVDCLVFGDSLSKYLRKRIGKSKIKKSKIKNIKIVNKNKKETKKLKKKVQDLMWDKVGIIRNVKDLVSALNELNIVEKKVDLLLKNGLSKEKIEIKLMATTSKLIVKSALLRKESRGTHFMEDFPTRDDKRWSKHILLRKQRFLN